MFELKQLPYKYEELEPVISAELLELHYTKHHQAYCTNFNKAIEENNLIGQSVEEIFSKISSLPKAVENHGGGYFNHEFFWESMVGENSEENFISENLKEKISENFGSFENFQEEFEKSAMTLFGSGWVWLVENSDGKLVIQQSFNQESPKMDFMIERDGKVNPLLNLDVWEHAYYPDYKNIRADFVKNFWKIVNWKMVEERLNR